MKMKTKMAELLTKYLVEKTPVFINGMGAGRIREVFDDCLTFETSRMETTKTGNKVFKEATIITLSAIETLSEGEKEAPKSEAEKEAEKDLEGL